MSIRPVTNLQQAMPILMRSCQIRHLRRGHYETVYIRQLVRKDGREIYCAMYRGSVARLLPYHILRMQVRKREVAIRPTRPRSPRAHDLTYPYASFLSLWKRKSSLIVVDIVLVYFFNGSQIDRRDPYPELYLFRHHGTKSVGGLQTETVHDCGRNNGDTAMEP